MKSLLGILLLVCGGVCSGCATLSGYDDSPSVRIVGIEPLNSEGLEARFEVKLRIQNPNESELSYDGVSVKVALNGNALLSGVSNLSGTIPRFSEDVISLPISVSAFGVVRQLLSMTANNDSGNGVVNKPIAYTLKGKLGAPNGSLGGVRFTDSGEFNPFSENEGNN